jgi:hypothetical protein
MRIKNRSRGETHKGVLVINSTKLYRVTQSYELHSMHTKLHMAEKIPYIRLFIFEYLRFDLFLADYTSRAALAASASGKAVYRSGSRLRCEYGRDHCEIGLHRAA